MKPRCLDLFCGAGGAARGYQMAGFHVTGVDIRPQPRYVGDELHQADALTFPLEGFDFIHASPPCQAHTAMRTMHNAKSHPDLIPATRARLQSSGIPFAIENVDGSPLRDPILLCGTMFQLGCDGAQLRRHRLFECSFPALVPECNHAAVETVGVYGGHLRNRRRARTIGVYGEGCRDSGRKFDKGVADFGVAQGRRAMDIEWMTIAELCQAIPPAFTEFLGRQILAQLARTER